MGERSNECDWPVKKELREREGRNEPERVPHITYPIRCGLATPHGEICYPVAYDDWPHPTTAPTPFRAHRLRGLWPSPSALGKVPLLLSAESAWAKPPVRYTRGTMLLWLPCDAPAQLWGCILHECTEEGLCCLWWV